MSGQKLKIGVLGVCVLTTPAANAPRAVQYAAYIHEILGHFGLFYESVAPDRLADHLGSLQLLLTIGDQTFDDSLKSRLGRWIHDEGGAWVSIGGICGMESLLGVSAVMPSYSIWSNPNSQMGEGYLDARNSPHPALSDLPLPLHYFNGVPVTARGATVLATTLDAHHRPGGHPGLTEHVVGSGRCFLITPDITGTVVRIQQGTAVTRDGVPAPDGTGPITDGVLKTDDGQALDWLLDREPVLGVPGLNAFLQPVADQWKALLLKCLLHAAKQQGVSLPLLWFYPRGLPALGHISHDTDGSDPALAQQLLDVLDEAGIRSTWCTILPAYAPAVIDAVRSKGHELATHYDAMTPGLPFCEEQFDRQWRELSEVFGDDKPITNKNHYLRWEGDCEFFQWCIDRGIRLDQTKGVSKPGGAGFNFGSCHLYRPIDPTGVVLDIHEMATPTQDLNSFVPEAVGAALLGSITRHYGILHLLFHPARISLPGVAEALGHIVTKGRDEGLEWWTAREIVLWEEARRSARWSRDAATGDITLTAQEPLAGATILILATEADYQEVDHDRCGTVERWGFWFRTVTTNLAAGESVRLDCL